MKKIALLILCVFSSYALFSQSIHDTIIINKIDKEFFKHKKIVNDYISKRDRAMEEHKIFKYNFGSVNIDDYIYRPYYDSLVLKKLPDSILLNTSLFSIKNEGIRYKMSKYQDNDSYKYYFSGYKENKNIVNFAWNTKSFCKENILQKESICRTYNGDTKSPLYSYTKYEQSIGNRLYIPIYSKNIDENKVSTERFYKKDFPLSEAEVLNILSQKIKTQSVLLMKNKPFIRFKTVLDNKGNVLEATPIYGNTSFNQEDANLASEIFIKILKTKKNKVDIKKIYVNESTPLYQIVFNSYSLSVDPSTGNILKMDFIIQNE
ncbi:hypothetical protein [Chryseobacterium sp.]|uniref:hypothetical protein n=1 Tax=Chryseobacterium sp. TaxID=1871047 RepID=UPI0025C22BFA|nr:hypothetical protein [Chryseobacterium sp.]MBV8325213.1 hypothetical protein [Chryseobacterium sp.]